MTKTVYKDMHLSPIKMADVLKEHTGEQLKVLIVFWHGLGDTLMFLPLYDWIKARYVGHSFDLTVLPGLGQAEFLGNDCLQMPEADFLKDHDVAFVMSFPMVEGISQSMTKAEYCCKMEVGVTIPDFDFGLPLFDPQPNKLIGLHLHGTCLPGSTNPDDKVAKMMWDDLKQAGYVPIDLHFLHAFHNPANAEFAWANRNCRDLPPNINTLQMLIERCAVVLAVASGPFVLSMCLSKQKTIYLQKHHSVSCYLKEATVKVIDLNKYASTDIMVAQEEREKFLTMVTKIVYGS